MSGNLTLEAKQAALNALDTFTWVSLHYAFSDTGLNELTPSIVYARQQLTWNVADPYGLKSMVAPLTWTTPPAETVYWIGLWDDPVAGTFFGMAPAQSSTPSIFMCNDTTGGLIFCQGHNFVDGDQVYLLTGSGSATLPGGFSEAFPYYVYGTMTDYFQISISPFIPEFPDDWTGVIVPASAGMGYAQRVVPVALDGIVDFTLLTFTIDSRLL